MYVIKMDNKNQNWNLSDVIQFSVLKIGSNLNKRVL